MSRSAAASLAENPTVKSMIIRRGVDGAIPRRFIAGEQRHEALQVVKGIKEDEANASLEYLGENFTTEEDTESSVAEYVEVIKAVSAFYPDTVVSVKLTAIGLATDPKLALTNLNRLMDEACGRGNVFLRVDMEGSENVDSIIKIVREVRSKKANIGGVLAAHLRRTDRDLDQLLGLEMPLRLVRGSYDESPKVAFTRKDEIDAAYRRQMFRLLDSTTFHTIATHDTGMIEAAKLYTKKRNIPQYRFEFELPLGGNPSLQQSLIDDGYRVRVNVPYGEAWFPYLVRSLGESDMSGPALMLGLLK
ncbi:MAG TPA: proline dehydrogenase family protein [Capsulimonadaceae bacterium]|jgi:proline dehydrogenase